jgi:hypothetical protein
VANNYLDQIPEAMRPYFQPYIDKGKTAGDKLTGQYDQMTQNPGEFYSNLGKGYTQSPGYQSTLREALAGANNAAAMGGGGGLGTPGHENYAANAAGDVANKDYEQYINHIMDVFGQGQKGQQQEEQQGYDASKDYGTSIGNTYGQKAQYGYAGQAGENQNRSNNWSHVFKTLGGIGGAVAGGPIGGLIGGGLGSSMFGGG